MCCKKISKKKLRSPFLILLVFAFFLILRLISPAEVLAQDSAEEPSAVEDPAPEDLIRSSITLDVETSTYYELQNWLFRLNLETSGTKQELASRLLRYYEAELGGLPPAVPEGTEGPDGKKSDSGTPERMEVQSAGRLEYLKDGEGDQLIRIDGGVVLQMKDSTSGTVHTVDAQRILFNRKNSSVTAEGDVFYRMGTDEKAQEI